jgi:anti-sigma regulatory factor (Ser/Thr protein kinase)/CheY-like chemotaxis protein
MTPHPLRIAYGDEPSPRADVVAESLRSQGHEVARFDGASGCLSEPEPDLYLLGRTLAGGASGLDCLADLRRAGRTAPVLLLDERPVFDELRRAIELGATDLLLHPLEGGELAAAIERAVAGRAPRARIEGEPRAHACERRYACDEDTVGRAAREVAAFLVNEGVASAHRVRIASAVAEVVDNACRHAYPQRKGEITVRVEVQRTRVQLSVEDTGHGFDVVRARLERIPAALPGARSPGRIASSSTGLGRVERLCEAHAVSSGRDGTRVELTFELTPVRFDEESEHLAETDFLDPARARSLVASLRKGRADLSGVPPAMALTIGRILGGLDVEIRPPTRR